jgi:hypothetical protein
MSPRTIRRSIERKAKKLESKRLLANQANAQLSTGPTSEKGKAKSCLNAPDEAAVLSEPKTQAIITAFTGSTVLLSSGDTAEYQRHLEAFEQEFQPVGLRECELVQSIADTWWRLRRIPALEMALFAKGRIEFADLFEEHELAARPLLIDAHTFITYEKQIRNLHIQEARLVRRHEKETAELRALREERIQKQQSQNVSKPAQNGFVFSTAQIEPHSPTALPENFDCEHASAVPTPSS